MIPALQFPTSLNALTMDFANTRATSRGIARRAMIRRSPYSSVKAATYSPSSSEVISGVCTQKVMLMACGTRSTLAPVEYRVGTMTGSVMGGAVIFLAINQLSKMRRAKRSA